MKYPSKLIETSTHGNRSRSALVKTVGITIPQEIPTGQFRPLPDYSLKVPKPGPVGYGINNYLLHNETYTWEAYYKIEIDGSIINSDFSKNLYSASEWEPSSQLSDGYFSFVWMQYGSSEPPRIKLLTPNPPVAYPQLATPHLVTFTTRDIHESDFSKNNGEYLIENNENGEFEVIEPGVFKVWMTETDYTAQELNWRDDTEYSNDISYTTERLNTTYLIAPPSGLHYSVNINGNVYTEGNLIGKTIHDGNYTLTFTEVDDLIELKLGYDGVIEGEVEYTRLAIRLTPVGDYTTWAVPVDNEYLPNKTSSSAYHYVDGQIIVFLSPTAIEAEEEEPYVPPVYEYNITTGFNNTTLSALIDSKLQQVKRLASEYWVNWLDDVGMTNSEYMYEPKHIQEVVLSSSIFSDQNIIFANHTKTVKQFKDGRGEWITVPIIEVIGDGSTYYRMKTVQALKEEEVYPYDYVPAGGTLTDWIASSGAGYINAAITSNYYYENPIGGYPGGVLTDYNIRSTIHNVYEGNPVSGNVGLNIRVYGCVNVAPGTVTANYLGNNSTGVMINTTMTNLGEVI